MHWSFCSIAKISDGAGLCNVISIGISSVRILDSCVVQHSCVVFRMKRRRHYVAIGYNTVVFVERSAIELKL